jgi:hypothetical protein
VVGETSPSEWPRHGYRRGHLLHRFADEQWRWADTGRFAGRVTSRTGDRPCISCGLAATPEGYDGCLGRLPGVTNACCGHGGVVQPYVAYEDGTVQRDDDVVWPPGVPSVPRAVWRGTDAETSVARDTTVR